MLLFFVTVSLPGQSLKLLDKSGKDITGDTLMVVFNPGTEHGWTELSIAIYIKNTSNGLLSIGSKKTEFNIQPDEYHSFCFAGFCFDSSTFISPFNSDVKSGELDSSFSGHYRFDDLLHIPNECLVAYTFFNTNNTADSAIVYVIYNTKIHPVGLQKFAEPIKNSVLVWPSPNTNILNIRYDLIPVNIDNKPIIQIINSLGEIIVSQILENNKGLISFETNTWKEGIYYYTFSGDYLNIKPGKFIVLK